MFLRKLKGTILEARGLQRVVLKERRNTPRTSDSHCTPLALTASMTASTFFSRARALAFRVTESFQGVFLNGVTGRVREEQVKLLELRTREVRRGWYPLV
jgi:hypothetical protein